MSPPTGIVIRTSWEYSPVQRTRRNSADVEGRAVVMSGKYCISCLGGSMLGVGKGAILLAAAAYVLDEVKRLLTGWSGRQ
jgi:hypothetical protein